MRRLFALTVALLTLWAALISVTRLGAESKPSQFAQAFTHPDGSACADLCIFGIIPGKTPMEQVIPILRQHPLSTNTDITDMYGVILADSPQFGFSAIRYGYGTITHAVGLGFDPEWGRIDPLDGGVPIGVAVAMFGSPQRLKLDYRNNQRVYLFYPLREIYLIAESTTTRLQLSDRLLFIHFGALSQWRSLEDWQGLMLSSDDWQGYRDLRPLMIKAGYP